MTLDEARENIGAGVVYRPHPELPAEDGEIVSVNDTYVFVALDVLPVSPLHDVADRRLPNAERDGEVHVPLTVGSASADFENLSLGEPSLVMSLPAHLALGFDGIGHIVRLGAEDQVRGLAARRIVARVPNYLAGRDRTDVDLVREGMHPAWFARDIESSVSVLVTMGGPLPAAVRRIAGHVPAECLLGRESRRADGLDLDRAWVARLLEAPRVRTAIAVGVVDASASRKGAAPFIRHDYSLPTVVIKMPLTRKAIDSFRYTGDRGAKATHPSKIELLADMFKEDR